MIDCASHYQLKHKPEDKRNILYVSTEGNITEGQMELIKMLADKQLQDDSSQITYIFDNDECGYKYAIKLDSYLRNGTIPELEKMSAEQLQEKAKQLNIDMPSCNDWNEALQNTLNTDKKKENSNEMHI